MRATGRLRLICAGLEDDAHAAAGDLAVDLVVAEVADAGAGCRLAVAAGLAGGRSRCDRRQLVPRYGRRGSARIGTEDGLDQRGMLGKASRVFLADRLLAGAAAELELDAESVPPGARAAATLRPRPDSPRSAAAACFQARSKRSAAALIQVQSDVGISLTETSDLFPRTRRFGEGHRTGARAHPSDTELSSYDVHLLRIRSSRRSTDRSVQSSRSAISRLV